MSQIYLVGDNPFIGVSHLSQSQANARDKRLIDPNYCAQLVGTCLENGAQGFMLTVCEKTLAILSEMQKISYEEKFGIYAMIPYVPEFVRIASTNGGIPGLAQKIGKTILLSHDGSALVDAFWGGILNKPDKLYQSYLSYEIQRLINVTKKSAYISSILLHEVVTDLAIALDMKWFINTHIEMLLGMGIRPGFETRNFPFLVNKLTKWNVDLSQITIAAPFNAIGFQMCPSKNECENVLNIFTQIEVIGFSLFAAGYLGHLDVKKYIRRTQNLDAIAIGVSNERQAKETFA